MINYVDILIENDSPDVKASASILRDLNARVVPKSIQRILLVEDDDDISELFADALRDEGYDVDVAGTFKAASADLDAHTYGLAIVDWKLPDGDGSVIADAAAQLGARTFLISDYLPQMPSGRAEDHISIMKPVTPTNWSAQSDTRSENLCCSTPLLKPLDTNRDLAAAILATNGLTHQLREGVTGFRMVTSGTIAKASGVRT